MRLSPREVDKLILHNVGALAQKRLARGLKLNHTEATALIASQCLEYIRDGKSVVEVMEIGGKLLGRRQVVDGVAELIDEVQVEGTFPDGTKLVTVHHPIQLEDGDLKMALYGSFLPLPALSAFRPPANAYYAESVPNFPAPGAVVVRGEPIHINAGRPVRTLKVVNLDDRPIQVGSHYHLVEANGKLKFDRRIAYGTRLNIPAGTAVRFEPGEGKVVEVVPIGGHQVIRGGNNLASGKVDPSRIGEVLAKAAKLGFAHEEEGEDEHSSKRPKRPTSTGAVVSREVYASMYGPTTGDRVRLGDTELVLEVEKDLTVYGDECKFGGGKVLREGQGQNAGATSGVLDFLITNALIVDYTGIYKADVGISGGRIVGIGKAGNPDVMDGVTPGMIFGVTTEVLSGEGLILTAGAIDSHVHFICPGLYEEAIASGITTLIGGGTGPATGTNATTCSPGAKGLAQMLQATDDLAINIGFTGKGNTSLPQGLQEQIDGGAVGLKLHEDWGTTPAAIKCCLDIAELNDIQVTIHTDTLNESCNVEDTINAFEGRTIHTYHSEGAGGGHAPDIIQVCGVKNVLPSSTNPTKPFTVNTLEEHVDMLMVCHHLSKSLKEDVAFAESRIRGETIAAEDILHDMGAISIISSDSQAMGRIGEVITRNWQTASKMKIQRGPLPEKAGGPAPEHDNFRIKRYIAKCTMNPAVAHGVSHVVGSVEVGKWADLVLWKPSFFGVKPELVIKGGMIAWSQMGDANASIPTPEPVLMRPMFGAKGQAPHHNSFSFVSKAFVSKGVAKTLGLKKQIEAVYKCRGLSKLDMRLNDALPTIKVDPETYQVTADGVELKCEPAKVLPLSQRYLLF